MVTHETVRKMTDGQRSDLIATMAGAIPPNFTFEEAQAIISKKGPFVAKIREAFKRRKVQSQPFEFIGTIVIPATTGPFAAREKFVVGNAQAKISWIGSNFQEWFFGKTEEPVAATELRYAKLTRSSLDAPILEELGDKAEASLSQMYALMARQANGQEGVLLTNGWANIFYVRDINGGLRAVGVVWGGDGWGVGASSVTDQRRWRDDNRVFSRSPR